MAPARQPSLFEINAAQARPPSLSGLPQGFVYQPQFLTAAEECKLTVWLGGLPFQAFQFRGFEAKRRVISFGWRYDFARSHLAKADDMPAELLSIRVRAAQFAGLAPQDLQQCLLNEYLPGAPIGWHRDRPIFETVLGISLLAPCTLRLRRRVGDRFQRAALEVAPRSIYQIAGEARTAWEHSIPPVKAHRYSVTFRNFRA